LHASPTGEWCNRSDLTELADNREISRGGDRPALRAVTDVSSNLRQWDYNFGHRGAA
jgi:hypothetical protein